MLTEEIPTEADYLIIGGGAAGCVLSRRLSDKYPNKKIVIVDQGKDRRHEKEVYRTENAPNIAYVSPFSSTMATNYDNVVCSFGTMYGGGTSHNFGLVVEGSAEFYKNFWLDKLEIDEFRLKKCIDRVNSVMPKFKVAQNINLDLSQTFTRIVNNGIYTTLKEGLNVLLNLGPLGMDEESVNKIMKAIRAESGDIPVIDNYNDALESISPQQILFVDPANGVRASSNRQYIPDHYYKKNLTIVENGKVDRIEGQNVILENGNKIRSHKIILAAGAIHTPLILLKSELKDNKIKEDMGKGLYNHYGVQMILGAKDVLNFSSGPLAYVAEDTGKRRKWQCLVVGEPLVNYGLLEKNGIDHVRLRKEGYTFISFVLFILNPTGEGRVTKDQISLNMFEGKDIITILDGMKWLKGISEKLKSENDKMKIIEGYPTEKQWKESDYLKLAKESLITTDHYSCSMNRLVDANFQLKDNKDIFIVDASVFPAIPDANTEFPALLLAEIASDKL
jgi:choline dehydrogenase-like flavoprotein